MKEVLSKEFISHLISRCTQAAHEAAGCLPNIKDQKLLTATTKGAYHEDVTKYDKKIEEMIRLKLASQNNDDSFLGEETGNHQGNSGIRWIIDPIDGTTNFIRKIPSYAISIAAEVNKKIVAGVVYDLAHKDTFTAGLELGAKCNGKKINSSNVCMLSEAVVSTGFSKNPEIRYKQAEILPKILTKVKDIRSCGSAALELCWLAAGKIDAYYEHDLRYWDLAAGALIASEAGASITVKNDLIVGASPTISQQLNIILEQ